MDEEKIQCVKLASRNPEKSLEYRKKEQLVESAGNSTQPPDRSTFGVRSRIKLHLGNGWVFDAIFLEDCTDNY